MQQYGVLVVDDSSFMRRCISLIIEKDPQFFIIGIARNGIDAIEKIQRLKPDVVTMDVEMPEMDGITALKEIMNKCPVPVVMLSNHTDEGAKDTIEALGLGAAEFFLKGELVGEEVSEQTIKEFLIKLKYIASGANTVIKNEKAALESKEEKVSEAIINRNAKADLIIIGCSTGGPSALQSILPRFSKDLNVPIVVVQHMPPGFTKPLAERFDTICNARVKEAENGDVLEKGTIYVAPSGFQTHLYRKDTGEIALRIDEKCDIETVYKPSINVTVSSAAPLFKDRLLSVILTGMGNDGLIGCTEVKKYNGHVVVEAEESCIVYGMPRVVQEAGLADIQVPLSGIYNAIMNYI